MTAAKVSQPPFISAWRKMLLPGDNWDSLQWEAGAGLLEGEGYFKSS